MTPKVFSPIISTLITFIFVITNIGMHPAYALRQPQAKGTSMAGAIGMDLDGTASAIGTAEIEQCSGIRLNRDPSVPTVPIASFTVIDARPERIDPGQDGGIFKINSDAVAALQLQDFSSFSDMTREMRDILKSAYPKEAAAFDEMSPEAIVQRFVKFASSRMQNFILKMAIEYNLDLHTEVVLQWGSAKLARYKAVPNPKVPGAHKHVLYIDIAAFIDNLLLQAEILHEILHPRVNPWLNNMHLDLPELIEAIPGAAVPFPDGYPEPGYYAQEAATDRPEAFMELAAGLGELFILLREMRYIDSQNISAELIEILRRPDNTLDRASGFADMLEKRGQERVTAILDFISDDEEGSAYTGSSEATRRIPKGARLLKRVDRALLMKALEYLHGRLDACLCEDMARPPTTLDEVAELIEKERIEQIEVFLDDEEGHLQGQEQSVLLIVNESTHGILTRGIGVDISSLKSSITGKPLSPITDSDGIAYIDPITFRINKLTVRGRRRAIISAQVRKPFEVEPAQLKREYNFASRRFVNISRSYPQDRARRAVQVAIKRAEQLKIRKLKQLGKPPALIENVKLLLSDFSGNTHIIEVPVAQLKVYLEKGVPLTAEQARYIPTTADKTNLVARLDPYSLRIVEYADDDEEIEALMLVHITDSDGRPFEGDYAVKLAETAEEEREKGRIIYASAEPEIYLFRRLPDGRLITADNSGYYSRISNLPYDVQMAFGYLTRAMETAGITARYIHPEVGPGQVEVPIEHQDLLKFADTLSFYKYIVAKSVAKSGLVASFLPKPIKGKAGSGMHVHISALAAATGQNLFYDPAAEYYLSGLAHSFMAGVFKYSYPILAIINPTVNAFLRLVAGFEAPCDLALTVRGRSGAGRIPAFPGGGSNAPAAREEYRVPSPMGNPYAQLWAIVEAGRQGVEENLPPLEIITENLYKMSPVEKAAKRIEQLPGRNDFLGIDGPTALKHAQALMLVEPDHPFVVEVKARMQQATYGGLTDEQKTLFREMYGIPDDQEQAAAVAFEDMKMQAITAFCEAIDAASNETARDRKKFIEGRLTPGELAYLASAEEAETAFMERNSLIGPAIVSRPAAGRALVVEDTRDIKRLLEVNLTKKGWQVDTVDNSAGIITKAEKGRYDLVIMDWRIVYLRYEDKTSDVINSIRQTGAAILIFTASSGSDVRQQLEDMGITDIMILEKPGTPAEILAAIDKLMEAKASAAGQQKLLRQNL